MGHTFRNIRLVAKLEEILGWAKIFNQSDNNVAIPAILKFI